MDSDSEERLDTGIDSLDQIEDLLGTRAKGFVGDDKNCIINRWGDLDIAGQEAILQKVGKAVSSIESHIDTSDTTGDIWRKRAKYLDLVPDVYELQKEMRGSLRDGIQWLDPIPQAIFSRALIRLVKATFAAVSAVKWRKDVEGSAVFQQWDLLHPRAQASILDETYKAIIPVREERRVSTQNHKNGKFESLYPKLERYQELAGSLQSHAQGSSARNVHESTIDRRQVSNAMPPPPVPSYVAGYRRIAAAPSSAYHVERRSLFHDGPVSAINHFPYDHTDTRFPSQLRECPDQPLSPDALVARYAASNGTRDDPMRID